MIATIDDIRSVRDIARNIGRDRIEPYILEVEHAYIVPAIGAELYERIDAGDEEDSHFAIRHPDFFGSWSIHLGTSTMG